MALPATVLVQSAGEADTEEFPSDYFNHADHIYRTIPLLVAVGANPTHICGLIDFGEQMWPGPVSAPNTWDAWRSWSPHLTCP
jgi:hypothetical protein